MKLLRWHDVLLHHRSKSQQQSRSLWGVAFGLVVLLVPACGYHTATRNISASKKVTFKVCERSSLDVTLAVLDESQRLNICSQLPDQFGLPAPEQALLTFVAEPDGRVRAARLTGSDQEEVGGQAGLCFISVAEQIVLSSTEGESCLVSVPIRVLGPNPAATAQSKGRDRPTNPVRG